jgi:hypothetical protein
MVMDGRVLCFFLKKKEEEEEEEQRSKLTKNS